MLPSKAHSFRPSVFPHKLGFEWHLAWLDSAADGRLGPDISDREPARKRFPSQQELNSTKNVCVSTLSTLATLISRVKCAPSGTYV